jgi:hypothetical protein
MLVLTAIFTPLRVCFIEDNKEGIWNFWDYQDLI